MIPMMLFLYGLTAIISIAEFLFLVLQDNKNRNVFQTLLFVLAIISNLGVLAVALSESVETIILANKITYVGSIFLPLLMLLTIADLCEVDLPRRLTLPLLVYCFVILGLVLSIGYSDIYYSSVGICKAYGVSYITKTYGPAHNLYTALLILEVLSTLGVIVRTLFYKKNFSKRTVWLLMFTMLTSYIIYFIPRALHFPLELLPFSYTINTTIYLFVYRRIRMYDIFSSIIGTDEHLEEYGYITFDLKYNLMNYNSVALKNFPELESAAIDSPIPKGDHLLYKEIVLWLQSYTKGKPREKMIALGKRYLKCVIHRVRNGSKRKIIGYTVEMVDDTRQQHYIQLLNHYNSDLQKNVEEKTAHIHAMQTSIVTGMASMVESRDNSTGGHIRRTSECVKIFVDALRPYPEQKLPETFWENVIKAAPMHDLGKIAVDDHILRKPGKYTPEEYELMKLHSEKGAEIVAEVLKDINDPDFVRIAVNIAHYHHEKWNGTGYPKGLKETEIPLEARIMALADVFDALVSKRCYKDAYSYDEAFRIIEESLGSHFDPVLGKIFISSRPQLEQLYDRKEN